MKYNTGIEETSFYKTLHRTSFQKEITMYGLSIYVYWTAFFFDKNNKAQQWIKKEIIRDTKKYDSQETFKLIIREYKNSSEYINNDYKYNICSAKDLEKRMLNDLHNKK